MKLALEVIEKVGPGGNFLAEEHTNKYFRHFFMPKLMTREDYHSWEQQGAKTCKQKVVEKTQWILQNHRVEPLDAAILEKLDKLLDEFEKNAETSRI